MSNLSKQLLSTCIFLTAGNACFGVGIETDAKESLQPIEWEAVSDESLDNMRGGFDVGPGLSVSFGIVRTITINGDLVNRTNFNLPDVTKITTEQANLARTAIAESGIIQNGTGNFIEPGVRSQLTNSTIVQNSLNDQRIQSLTVINTGVNSLGLLKNINTQTILKDALMGSIGLR